MRELRYVNNPNRTRLAWVAVYGVIAIALIVGLLIAGSQIRTHSLPDGDIQLSIPYSKYLVGEVVTYSLKNNYDSSVYVSNKCPSEPLAVYRYQKNGWVRIHASTTESKCSTTARDIAVPARGIINGTFANWKELFAQPGYYRVVAYVEYYDALPYQDFEVVAASKSTSSAPKPTTSSTASPSPSTANSGDSTTTSGEDNTVSPPATPTYTEKKGATVSSKGGKITVQYDSTTVYVTSIAPASGCSYEGGKSGTEVEVTFKCSYGEIQVQLWVENGKLTGKAETGD